MIFLVSGKVYQQNVLETQLSSFGLIVMILCGVDRLDKHTRVSKYRGSDKPHIFSLNLLEYC
jgi:hypothetical protein